MSRAEGVPGMMTGCATVTPDPVADPHSFWKLGVDAETPVQAIVTEWDNNSHVLRRAAAAINPHSLTPKPDGSEVWGQDLCCMCDGANGGTQATETALTASIAFFLEL